MKKIIRFLLVIAIAASCLCVNAAAEIAPASVPANPGPFKVNNGKGETVKITMVGDENFSFNMDMKSYVVLWDSDDVLRYLMKTGNGFFLGDVVTNEFSAFTDDFVNHDTVDSGTWLKAMEYIKSLRNSIADTKKIKFDDVKTTDWFYDSVKYVVQKGIMSGTKDNCFEPDKPLTREMLAAILYNIEGQPENEGKTSFEDVKENQWYTKAIAWAEKNGIMQGRENSIFGLGESVTREQMAAVLYRYSKYKNCETAVTVTNNTFNDSGSVSEYAKEAVAWAEQNGIMTGYDNNFNPQAETSRAQSASVMARFLQRCIK